MSITLVNLLVTFVEFLGPVVVFNFAKFCSCFFHGKDLSTILCSFIWLDLLRPWGEMDWPFKTPGSGAALLALFQHLSFLPLYSLCWTPLFVPFVNVWMLRAQSSKLFFSLSPHLTPSMLVDLMTFNSCKFQISIFSSHSRCVSLMTSSTSPLNVFWSWILLSLDHPPDQPLCHYPVVSWFFLFFAIKCI